MSASDGAGGSSRGGRPPAKGRDSAGGRGGRTSAADRSGAPSGGRRGEDGRRGPSADRDRGGPSSSGRREARSDGGAGQSQRGSSRGEGRGGSRGEARSGSRDEARGGPRKEARGGSRAEGRGGSRADSRGGSRGGARGGRREDERTPRTADQAAYDGPDLDESITGRELDRQIAQQLRGLPEKLAARVARHLVAAGLAMDSDPELAYQHTLAARARSARIAVVREACGEAAYAAGHFAEALSELRAAKRMNGSQDYLHVMADCERALGRPDRALRLAQSPAVADLPTDLKAEVTIVEAGARRDLGEVEAALRTLENAPLRSKSREEWAARLRYAYADTLLAAGRRDEAVEWFHRTAAIDPDGVTDAVERVEELDTTP